MSTHSLVVIAALILVGAAEQFMIISALGPNIVATVMLSFLGVVGGYTVAYTIRKRMNP